MSGILMPCLKYYHVQALIMLIDLKKILKSKASHKKTENPRLYRIVAASLINFTKIRLLSAGQLNTPHL